MMVAFTLMSCSANNAGSESPSNAPAKKAKTEKMTKVKLETSLGNIVVQLYNETPQHRDNFIKLVKEGYYDGVLFHRVIKDFMIQTGDGNSKTAGPDTMLGDGDPGYTIEAEFVYPKYFHKRGALAAARTGDQVNPERRSSGSQFYIVWGKTFSSQSLEKVQQRLDTVNPPVKLTEEMIDTYRRIGGTPHLDGQYTVFGEVIEGLDVVERITKVLTDDYDRPINDVRILKATCIE